MIYPKMIASDSLKIVTALETRQAQGIQLTPAEISLVNKSKADYQRNKDGLSIVGLERPIFPLKNPGIVSIPLGFMAAILVAFAFPSRTEEEMFNELLVRQQTGFRISDIIEER
jgi:cation/acetate symporter